MTSGADGTGSRFLVTGAGGKLGRALVEVLRAAEVPFKAFSRDQLDITDARAVMAAVSDFSRTRRGHDWILNAAAYTDVARAECDRDAAFDVNEDGVRLLALAARDAGLGLAHVSTDFVFDGEKDGPYAEEDRPRPLNVYGASKLAGERAAREAHPDALIVRTAWLFGAGKTDFTTKVLARARSGETLRVVTDEVGSPTYAHDLAEAILALTGRGARGVYHLAGSGACSRFEFAEETLRQCGLDAVIEPVTRDAWESVVARPANSVLDCAKAEALGVGLPEWRDALARYVADTDVFCEDPS